MEVVNENRELVTNCRDRVKNMREAADWITNIDHDALSPEDDTEQDAISEVLVEIRQGFADRPSNCRMKNSGDYIYDCSTCSFSINLDY